MDTLEPTWFSKTTLRMAVPPERLRWRPGLFFRPGSAAGGFEAPGQRRGHGGLIERLLKEKLELVADDLRDHQTFESWGKEGFELAKRAVYLNGELKPSK